jgi:hypothetical protein
VRGGSSLPYVRPSLQWRRDRDILERAVHAVTEQASESRHLIRPDELERRLRERLDALGPMGSHALLTILLRPDSEWAAQIGKLGRHRRAGGPPNC